MTTQEFYESRVHFSKVTPNYYKTRINRIHKCCADYGVEIHFSYGALVSGSMRCSWWIKLQLQRWHLFQCLKSREMGSTLTCCINNAIELCLLFFLRVSKEFYGFKNTALYNSVSAQFPLMLSTLKNAVNKTQRVLQKAISIIVFCKDHSTPTSKASNT